MRAGGWIAAGLVGTALAADVALIKTRREPISTCVRDSRVGRAVTLLLALHLLGTWRFDPLRWAGGVVESRLREGTRCCR